MLLQTTLTIILLIIAVDSYSLSSTSLLPLIRSKSISRGSTGAFRGNIQKRGFSSISAANVPLAISLPQASGQNWWIWSLLASTSSLGIVLEDTKIGAMLSSPLVTMGISLILCNLGVLPSSSPVYSIVLKVCRTQIITSMTSILMWQSLVHSLLDVRSTCGTTASSRC